MSKKHNYEILEEYAENSPEAAVKFDFLLSMYLDDMNLDENQIKDFINSLKEVDLILYESILGGLCLDIRENAEKIIRVRKSLTAFDFILLWLNHDLGIDILSSTCMIKNGKYSFIESILEDEVEQFICEEVSNIIEKYENSNIPEVQQIINRVKLISSVKNTMEVCYYE